MFPPFRPFYLNELDNSSLQNTVSYFIHILVFKFSKIPHDASNKYFKIIVLTLLIHKMQAGLWNGPIFYLHVLCFILNVSLLNNL